MGYEQRATKYSQIFDSKLSIRLIIEAVFFCPQQEHGQYMERDGKSLGELPFMSIENPTLAHFRHFNLLYTDFPSTNVENVRQIIPFYAKQTQFYAFFARKRRFHEKTKPKQTQFKPNLSQNKPNLSQFKPNSNPIINLH